MEQSTVNNSGENAAAIPKPTQKAKYWCITINNYTDDDIRQFEDIKQYTAYWIYGKEVGASGTSHLQCFICGNKQITLPTLRRWWPRSGHFEITRGSPKEASDYCKKDGQFVEFGVLPEGRHAAQIKGGNSTKQLWTETKELAKKGSNIQYLLELVDAYQLTEDEDFLYKLSLDDFLLLQSFYEDHRDFECKF